MSPLEISPLDLGHLDLGHLKWTPLEGNPLELNHLWHLGLENLIYGCGLALPAHVVTISPGLGPWADSVITDDFWIPELMTLTTRQQG